MPNPKNVVLAYSGGLDTSYCLAYLNKELQYHVHAVSVNTGGFNEEDVKALRKNAMALGAKSFTCIEAKENFYNKSIRYLVFGNVLRNNCYPLSVSAERIHQAQEVAQHASLINADAIAHGSTGAGNDQVRFDLCFSILVPQMEIITPIRDQQLSRQEEVEYLMQCGYDYNESHAAYSINEGMWGTSIGGKETLGSDLSIPESAYPNPVLKTTPIDIELDFHKGEIFAVNGNIDTPIKLISALNELASNYGIGRDTHVGDTIIGIKGRVAFEAAAPMLIIKAHELLEKHTLSKWQMYWKNQLSIWYGMQVHEGQLFDPILQNIESFLEATQTTVCGKVFLRLHPYRFELIGIESKYDLMNSNFGTYGEMNNAWSGQDVKGFTKILANSFKIFHQINSTNTTA